MIKSYSLKHKIRGEGRERGHCCVCVWVPGQGEWPCGFSLIPWLSGAVLGPHAWAPAEAFDHEINPTFGSFTGLCSSLQCPHRALGLWAFPLCVLPLLSSILPVLGGMGGVCSLLKYCVCGLCQPVGQSGVYVCLWTRVHGVAVLCSIKLSYT